MDKNISLYTTIIVVMGTCAFFILRKTSSNNHLKNCKRVNKYIVDNVRSYSDLSDLSDGIVEECIESINNTCNCQNHGNGDCEVCDNVQTN